MSAHGRGQVSAWRPRGAVKGEGRALVSASSCRSSLPGFFWQAYLCTCRQAALLSAHAISPEGKHLCHPLLGK
jgi:hypothetical protein